MANNFKQSVKQRMQVYIKIRNSIARAVWKQEFAAAKKGSQNDRAQLMLSLYYLSNCQTIKPVQIFFQDEWKQMFAELFDEIEAELK